MTEATEKAGQRDRSPAYPIIPLETALERLAAFEAHFKRSAARPEKAGEAWGIKAKAYAGRTLAALRYFGLVEYQGSGKDRRVVVSDEGRKYLRAQQETTKREVIRTAALRPRPISQFWKHWGADRPADAACIDDLVLHNGFSEGGAREFLKVYDDTISFSGLSDSDKVNHAHDGEEGDGNSNGDQTRVAVDDLIQWTSGGADQFAQAKRVRAVSEDDQWVFVEGSKTGIPMDEVIVEAKSGKQSSGQRSQPPILPLDDELPSAGQRKEITSLDEGNAVLIWPEKLSQASYGDLETWLNAILEKTARRAGVQRKKQSNSN